MAYGGESGLWFNDARRTFVNLALDSNQPVRALTDTTGHSVQTMAKHYARSTKEQKRTVVQTGRNFGGILSGDFKEFGKSSESGKKEKPSEVLIRKQVAGD